MARIPEIFFAASLAACTPDQTVPMPDTSVDTAETGETATIDTASTQPTDHCAYLEAHRGTIRAQIDQAGASQDALALHEEDPSTYCTEKGGQGGWHVPVNLTLSSDGAPIYDKGLYGKAPGVPAGYDPYLGGYNAFVHMTFKDSMGNLVADSEVLGLVMVPSQDGKELSLVNEHIVMRDWPPCEEYSDLKLSVEVLDWACPNFPLVRAEDPGFRVVTEVANGGVDCSDPQASEVAP